MLPGEETLRSIRIPNHPQKPAIDAIRDSKCYELVDQLVLPHIVEWVKIGSAEDAYDAIKTMKVRGAPAIGSAAALGIAVDLAKGIEDNQNSNQKDPSVLFKQICKSLQKLVQARPTAVNLSEATRRIQINGENLLREEPDISFEDFSMRLIECAFNVWEEDLERNLNMSRIGVEWIEKQRGSASSSGKRRDRRMNVLTVCNTGSLATSGHGTALGLIMRLHSEVNIDKVYFAQTGPYNQGARLTALELQSLGIENAIMVPDTAIASLLSNEWIDLFIAGADRIAVNGDTANKVSTHQIALLCKHVPLPAVNEIRKNPLVIISAPWTTVDTNMATGEKIVIEQRPQLEACTVRGRILENENDDQDIRQATVLFTPQNTKVYNPAFDVTPGTLIDAIVTDHGVCEAAAGESFRLNQ